MWELDYKESWVPKNWSFWTVVLEKTLESPLDCKKIKPVNCKENQSGIFIGRTNAEAETPILWPPDENWLTGKGPEAGKDWRQELKGKTEDEIVGWLYRLNRHEWVWTSSRSWWWTGRPGVLQPTGSQRVGHEGPTEWMGQDWTVWRKAGERMWLGDNVSHPGERRMAGARIVTTG